MSAHHTPGPFWVEGSIYDGYAACVVGRVVNAAEGGRETRTLAQVRTLPDSILFAEAPDLLALCREAFEFLGGVDDAAELRGKLLAAIAKAEGRS